MGTLGEILAKLFGSLRPNRSSTVRYAFPFLFAAVLAMGAASIVSDTESYVRLESSTAKIEKGEWFWVNVYAYASTPVNAVDISLEFPQEQVEVIGIDTGESVITIWTEDPYVSGNQVILRGGTFRRGFVGEHLIATINMRGLATGIAQFDTAGIRFLAGDGAGTEVATEDEEGPLSIYIYNASQSPEDIAAAVTLQVITDLDGDGKVTLRDISRFMAAWFDKGAVKYDFNGDGRMTFKDFSIILADSFFK